MAFHGAAAAAAVVTAAGARNVQAVGSSKMAVGSNVFNSEMGSGGGGFHSNESRRGSVMNSSNK